MANKKSSFDSFLSRKECLPGEGVEKTYILLYIQKEQSDENGLLFCCLRFNIAFLLEGGGKIADFDGGSDFLLFHLHVSISLCRGNAHAAWHFLLSIVTKGSKSTLFIATAWHF